MTPREKVLRDALEEIVANEFMLMAHAKALAALAAADAIPDAPVSCCAETRAATLREAAWIADGYGIAPASKALRDMANEPGAAPVPSRAELIELIVRQWNRFPADVHDNEAAARVLDALIKAGAVRAPGGALTSQTKGTTP